MAPAEARAVLEANAADHTPGAQELGGSYRLNTGTSSPTKGS
jgi:hypothetical protein